MSTSCINFNDKKIKKKATFIIKTKKIFNIDDIDANKISVSKYNSFKYLIAYNDTGFIKPLYFLFHRLLATLLNLIKIK